MDLPSVTWPRPYQADSARTKRLILPEYWPGSGFPTINGFRVLSSLPGIPAESYFSIGKPTMEPHSVQDPS